MADSEDGVIPSGNPHKDRSVGLVLFGALEVLIGLFCALLVPLSLLAAVATASLAGPETSPDLKAVASSFVIYGCAAVTFVWIGIGSIRARRWAQKLTLVLSWLWLITGVVTIVMSLWMIPMVLGQAGLEAGMPAGSYTIVLLVVFGFLGMVFVVMPAAFVLFYRSHHVVATCRMRDPGPSRIADAPSHILSLVLIYVLGAVSVLTMPAYNFVMPVFGTVLSGLAGAMGWVFVLVLLGYLVWATLDRDPRAWWVAVAATVVAMMATTVSALAIPIDMVLEMMDLPADQVAIVRAMGLPGPMGLVLLSVIAWASFLGYLWYTRRFFADR
jgi:hypothetical protein